MRAPAAYNDGHEVMTDYQMLCNIISDRAHER